MSLAITGANFERTCLSVHGKVLQIHVAGCTDCQALRVKNSAIWKQSEIRDSKNGEEVMQYCIPDKPVRSGDSVKIASLAIVNKGIRFPDLAQHLYRKCKC